MTPNRNIPAKDYLKNIFDMYYNSLVSYANYFLPLKMECEDLVQDIFVSIWEERKTFTDDISLKVYLYKSTRNRCYNSIKHNKVKDKYAASNLKSLENDNLFLNQVLEEEIVRQLHEAIELLPERKKEIIKLSLKGLKNNEIADDLDIKLQTVKTLKSQSYKILRDKFKDLSAVIYFTQVSQVQRYYKHLILAL